MKLRPFFSYFGSKWSSVPRLYPSPDHDTIIEPFAGSASYSVRYPDRCVVLYDLDPVVCGVWDYLIHATPKDIINLPDVGVGETIPDNIHQEARWLIGFWLAQAVSSPRTTKTKWGAWSPNIRHRLADQVCHIRHWRIVNSSYENCPNNAKATWFVDPPYQHIGIHYKCGSSAIDYDALATWCRSRKGQVIVCEAEGADWLPFAPAGKVRSASKKYHMEAVWIK